MTTENGTISDAESVVREARDGAARAVEREQTPLLDTLTLSNGCVLRFKAVSGLLLRRASSQIEKPKVPMWHNEDRGRDEPNPGDPDYQDALERYDEATGMAALNAMFMIGMKVEHVAEGVSPLEADDWIDALEFLEINVAREGPARRLDWLKYEVLANAADLVNAQLTCARFSGLNEEDVLGAIASFRRGEERRTDPASGAAEDNRDGNQVQPAPAGVPAEDGAGD